MKFDIEKIVVNAPVRTIKATWTPVEREKLKPKFTYERGHPAGYTDDLGIIADENQWVGEQREGWYSDIDPQDYIAMHEWCVQNFNPFDWHIGTYHIFIENEKDVAWFMLRWS